MRALDRGGRLAALHARAPRAVLPGALQARAPMLPAHVVIMHCCTSPCTLPAMFLSCRQSVTARVLQRQEAQSHDVTKSGPN